MSSLFKSDDTKYEYLFDGNNISLLKDGGVVKSWKAVSGKDGYQSPEFQNVKGKGPIPEGEYDVRQDEHSHMSLFDDIFARAYPYVREIFPSLPKRMGAWTGGYNAWGADKIHLIPTGQQEMFGRDGFFIHGGTVPGSAGCIDLTDQNPNFMTKFLTLKRDIPLKVKYESKDKTEDPDE